MGAVGRRQPELKIACAVAERGQKVTERGSERERLCQSNSVVVSASRIDRQPSPAQTGPSVLKSLLSLLWDYNSLFRTASVN